MPKKVFELAKELNLKPLELVEKLREHGIVVRSHMSELSDDDAVKIVGILAPPTPAASDKTSKGGVVRKKVAKPTVVAPESAKRDGALDGQPVMTEASLQAEGAASSVLDKNISDAGKGVKGAVVRKKVTVRKKGSVEGSTEEAMASVAAETETVEQESQGVEAPQHEPQVTTEKVEDLHKRKGLRVVALPVKQLIVEAAPEEVEATVEEVVETSKPASKDYFEEKVHRFTPVFIPPKVEPKKVPERAAEPRKKDKDGVDIPMTEAEAEIEGKRRSKEIETDADEKSSKKRLGGLASIMSGKRPILSRSQALSHVRAETELKSYSLLSGLGRPIYSAVKRKKVYSGPAGQTEKTEVKESKRVIYIHQVITAQELAQKLSQKFQDFADQMLDINLLVKPTDYIGINLANEMAALYNYRVEDSSFDESEVLVSAEEAKRDKTEDPLRPPVVTIMGHVDHGKTSLLDYIRKAKIAEGEAGGITQHIGAYTVKVKDKSITFLDTPGHAAFANMRQRGANLTDIVILVVAADDGVMPQTKESIRFCQTAKVPIIVAMNKMDKEGANPEKIKTALTEFHLTAEDWGGETQFVPISAVKGTGIDNLLDGILLQSEIMELRASGKGLAKGVVIESKIEQGRGPVATVLIQEGTLRKGDPIVVGETFGRARSLTDYLGNNLLEAGPSTPVQILGLESVPSPGDSVYAVKNEREAKKIVDSRISKRKELEAVPEKKKMSLEDFFGEAKNEDEVKNLNLVVRSDVQGSFEAIKNSLEALSNSEVVVKVVGGGVGAISDSDVLLAASSKAFIIGFNMRPLSTARRLAEEHGIDIKTYSIIYDLINDVTLALEGLLTPEYVEEFVGRAEVRNVFNIPKIGAIAGSYVTDGKIQHGCNVRLLRSGKIVYDGKLTSLKRFKDDAKEVKTGFECGVGLENYNDIKVGDIFEVYHMAAKKRKLEDVAAADASDRAAKATRGGTELSHA
ncbi:MAG: translation initiation factor IF-2 [Bdellovibrionales bacterium GWA2_49_15]|nr:MAG: translation initiation factor IF-2 [Bdellovibrionales bacterium GWA2_49_15]HAZ12460.1 translation initiation factor IF-2 [Bdellovibrionales bacterium]